MLASDRPTRGRIGQDDQIQPLQRPAGTLRLQLAQMQGQRYWIERAFEDGKGECGLADYQALGWRSWTPCRGFLDRADCSALLCRRPRRRDASGIGLEST